ncbi:hypothetical protein MRX96_023456 [Rhipicephalus microplus]|uniref:uncharacterized protein LOC119180050 isoform X5 n=1 Tax=Rhipicephalus microplus TaxID=6941 RepID=UPI001887037F|nr:uncharacterized protein LOC119180050 isoform X4 [Rhipicephalus microplus]
MTLFKMSVLLVILRSLCISLVLNDISVVRAMDVVSDSNGPELNISSSDCFELRLPDVFSIGECIREQRDLCEEKKRLPRAIVAVGCTLLGAFANLDTVSAIMLIRDIYVALAERRFHNAANVVDYYLYAKKYSGHIGDQVCEGELIITLPNIWTKASQVWSIIHLEECIARDFFDHVPQDAIEDLFCDFLKNVQVSSAAVLKAKGLLMLIFKDKCL